MKIVVADDSRAMRMIVVRTLRQAGFTGHEVLEAENGREALELVTEHALPLGGDALQGLVELRPQSQRLESKIRR